MAQQLTLTLELVTFSVTLGGNRTFGDPNSTGDAIGSSGSIKYNWITNRIISMEIINLLRHGTYPLDSS